MRLLRYPCRLRVTPQKDARFCSPIRPGCQGSFVGLLPASLLSTLQPSTLNLFERIDFRNRYQGVFDRFHNVADSFQGGIHAIAFARDEKPFAFLTEERLQGCLTAVLAKVSEAWEIGVRRKMKRDVAKSIGHRWSGELGDRDDAAERMRFQSSRPSHESIAKRPGPVS